eukprot:4108042-Heterocapsa_arctica.AAC.1
MSKTHDAVLWEEGGFLLPREGNIAKKIRKELTKMLDKYSRSEGGPPLYREGALYNFYLKKTGAAELAPLDPPGEASGFGWPATAVLKGRQEGRTRRPQSNRRE